MVRFRVVVSERLGVVVRVLVEVTVREVGTERETDREEVVRTGAARRVGVETRVGGREVLIDGRDTERVAGRETRVGALTDRVAGRETLGADRTAERGAEVRTGVARGRAWALA